MRSSILLSTLLLLQPCPHTLASPLQRRAPPFPDKVVGPSEAHADIGADAPPPRPPNPSEQGDVGPAGPPARADAQRILPPDLADPPPEIPRDFVQRIADLLNAGGADAPVRIQAMLDDLAARTSASWEAAARAAIAQDQKFRADQEAATDDFEGRQEEALMTFVQDQDTAQALEREKPAFLEARRAAEAEFQRVMEEREMDYQATKADRVSENDERALRTHIWLDLVGQAVGTRKEPSVFREAAVPEVREGTRSAPSPDPARGGSMDGKATG